LISGWGAEYSKNPKSSELSDKLFQKMKSAAEDCGRLQRMFIANASNRNMQRSIKTYSKIMAITLTLCLVGISMSGTAFAQRCEDNNNGTVTDNVMRLVWQKDTVGQTWWRLPDRQELLDRYDSPCKNMMTVKPDWYWSSTGFDLEENYALAVNFSGGAMWQLRSNKYYVRAVRQAK